MELNEQLSPCLMGPAFLPWPARETIRARYYSRICPLLLLQSSVFIYEIPRKIKNRVDVDDVLTNAMSCRVSMDEFAFFRLPDQLK